MWQRLKDKLSISAAKGMVKKMKKQKNHYEFVVPLCKTLSPIMTAAFFIAVVSILILIIVSAIVFFVNVAVDDMLLPPFMKQLVTDEGIASYAIDFGGGFKTIIPKEGVTLDNIKSVIYAFILVFIASLVMLAPVFYFLSKLFRNVGEQNFFSQDNARMINRIGFVVIFGSLISEFAHQFYTYTLANTFLAKMNENVMISFSLSWKGIVIGGFLIILGSIYGKCCEVYRQSQTNSVVKV